MIGMKYPEWPTVKNLVDFIKAARNCSQREVARRAGVSESVLCKVLKRKNCFVSTYQKLYSEAELCLLDNPLIFRSLASMYDQLSTIQYAIKEESTASLSYAKEGIEEVRDTMGFIYQKLLNIRDDKRGAEK